MDNGDLDNSNGGETQYDFDLFVIGAGSGGVRASRFSAQYGAKVQTLRMQLQFSCVHIVTVHFLMLVSIYRVRPYYDPLKSNNCAIKLCWKCLFPPSGRCYFPSCFIITEYKLKVCS